MNDDPKRPILMLLTANWVSMLGAALVTTVGFSWLFALPTQRRGHANNPCIGILAQDWNTCHEPLAVEEADPQILNTLNLADRIAGVQKKSTPEK